MYWGNWPRGPTKSGGSIERAWMDGNNRTSFVNLNIHWPISLTIDFFTRRLYWSDVFNDRIERIDLDGNNREVVKQQTPYPYGIALYNDLLFWTETNHMEVLVKSYNLINKSEEILGIEKPPLFTLKVYNSEAQGKHCLLIKFKLNYEKYRLMKKKLIELKYMYIFNNCNIHKNYNF